jgi:gingipain R
MLHRSRLSFVQVVLVSTVLAATAVQAAWRPLAGDQVDQRATIRTARDGATVMLTVTVPGLDLARQTVAGQSMVAVTVPGAGRTLEAGAPELPVLAQAVRLPARGEPRLEILNEDWRVVGHEPPVPSRGPLSRAIDPQQVPRVPGAMYTASAVWPARAAELGRPFVVRDQRGVAVRIHPVRWDAGRGELLALASMTLRVVVEGDGGVNVIDQAVKSAPQAFGPLHRALFGDDARAGQDKTALEDVPGMGYGASERMLIVTAPSLRAAVEPLAAWKRECGHLVEVVDMDELGGTVIGLGEAIDSRYFSDQGLAYLQIVGDVAQVPTRVGSYHGADSDGLYGLLSGDDLYVDILVSRLPASTPGEAAIMIDRIIAYERDASAGAAWYAQAAGIASDEGTPPDYERAEWLRDDLIAADYDEVARIYQGFGGDRTDIATVVEAGCGLVNYIGHGSGTGWLSVPFENADVHALTNTTAWPWIIDVSCSNGDFSVGECFAEAWLRSQHEGQPTGAVAIIAASTATSWVPPCVMQETMIDALTLTGESELGALYAAGVGAVLVMYEGLAQDQKLMEQYNLLGDASLRVRTRAPEPMTVTHASWVPSGNTPWSVSAPVDARVVLTAGDERLARADVGSNGEVTLTAVRSLEVGETVRLTVTADDAVTYRTELVVQNAATPVDTEETPPAATALLGNWPNPFNPATTIAFETATAGRVRVSIVDARGRLVCTLAQDERPAGHHEVRWNGRDASGRAVSAGVYFARLDAGGRSWARAVTLVK